MISTQKAFEILGILEKAMNSHMLKFIDWVNWQQVSSEQFSAFQAEVMPPFEEFTEANKPQFFLLLSQFSAINPQSATVIREYLKLTERPAMAKE